MAKEAPTLEDEWKELGIPFTLGVSADEDGFFSDCEHCQRLKLRQQKDEDLEQKSSEEPE